MTDRAAPPCAMQRSQLVAADASDYLIIKGEEVEVDTEEDAVPELLDLWYDEMLDTRRGPSSKACDDWLSLRRGEHPRWPRR